MPLVLERKRSVAYRTPIKEVLEGRFVVPGGFNPNYVLTPLGLKIARVNIIATAVNTYISSDNKYAFLVLDDGSGVVRVKAFQDVKLLQKIRKGDLVRVVGKIREYNKERYIVPELVKKIDDANEEALQRLEVSAFLKEWREKRKAVFSAKKECASIEELKTKLTGQVSEEEVDAILETELLEEEKTEQQNIAKDADQARATILKLVQELDKGEGVDYSSIIQAAGLPEPVAENAINELLSEGSCFEPRAGKIKAI